MYTAEDVIAYFDANIGVKKTRKRDYLDKRNYVIALLYYKFNYSELVLEGIYNIDRSTINHGKKSPHDLIKSNNQDFLINAKELIKLFPYDFPIYEGHAVSNRQHMVRISLDKETYDKLKNYSELKDMYINRATKELLTKAIKLWEE